MAVYVNNAISEVVPEAEASTGGDGGGEGTQWEEVEKLRATNSRLLMEKLRTSAEGFDD
ncbi:MAG TPA: hypothetical protein VGN95_09130 [Pyrinomonadaceae bacterium]|jgi:hypothetical protein|nr:hypothetical protein [Pyrinomonadaceae bacterium]